LYARKASSRILNDNGRYSKVPGIIYDPTLLRLNQLGYGTPGSPRKLTLVYNPVGPSLPPNQEKLEADYRRELISRYGVEFTELHTTTNLPISRFLDDLLRKDQFEPYMQKLIDSLNPFTVEGVMCRSMISVDWEGYLYDCDFNQMLAMKLSAELPQYISEFDMAILESRAIQTGRRCFVCTAGSGSGCQGAVPTIDRVLTVS
jgi:radical SAM/Cys-rich protein